MGKKMNVDIADMVATEKISESNIKAALGIKPNTAEEARVAYRHASIVGKEMQSCDALVELWITLCITAEDFGDLLRHTQGTGVDPEKKKAFIQILLARAKTRFETGSSFEHMLEVIGALKAISDHISRDFNSDERMNLIKEAATKAIVLCNTAAQAHHAYESVWNHLPDQQKTLLAERWAVLCCDDADAIVQAFERVGHYSTLLAQKRIALLQTITELHKFYKKHKSPEVRKAMLSRSIQLCETLEDVRTVFKDCEFGTEEWASAIRRMAEFYKK